MRGGCAQARRELTRGIDRVSADVARHVASCAACDSFAARLAIARDGLREHRAHVVPDAGFAARVTAALPAAAAESDAMSRTALRLLPAALALALVLGAWCWLETASPASVAGVTTGDDVLSWVLETEDGT